MPNESWNPALRAIRNAKNYLIVCFCTFPLYILAINALLQGGNNITSYMLMYMALYAGFGINASVKRCPQCHEQFYVRHFFLNIFRNTCAHCGLPAKPV